MIIGKHSIEKLCSGGIINCIGEKTSVGLRKLFRNRRIEMSDVKVEPEGSPIEWNNCVSNIKGARFPWTLQY